MARDEDLEDDVHDEDEYEDDDYDDEDDEGGLSGFVVLLMGVVMLGAFASVVYIAYQQGLKNNESGTPYVSADPDPIKIENAASSQSEKDRIVYDTIDGTQDETLEVVAQAPEEPVTRAVDDPIGAIADAASGTANDVVDLAEDHLGAAGAEIEDAVADRIDALEKADERLADAQAAAADKADEVVRDVTSAASSGANTASDTLDTIIADATGTDSGDTPGSDAKPVQVQQTHAVPEPETVVEIPTPSGLSADAMSGSHLVQVGAFRSEDEADGYWASMGRKLGTYVDTKAKHIERADLGERGVYYRLRVGPFASSQAAGTYCEGLKSRGQDCLVKAK